MGLKALVTVHLMVDGERKEFLPGSDLPEINAHDTESLLAMGAVEDSGAVEKLAKDKVAAEKAAAKEFDKARKATKAAQESAADGAPADAGN